MESTCGGQVWIMEFGISPGLMRLPYRAGLLAAIGLIGRLEAKNLESTSSLTGDSDPDNLALALELELELASC